jgi:hypothetical protein
MSRRRRRNPSRGEWRPTDDSPPLLPRADFLLAALLGVGVLVAIVIVVLASRHNGEGGAVPPGSTATPAVAGSPDPADAAAIESLARLSIEVLPRGEWPSLYDSFTSDFQQRCSRGDFAQLGQESAQQQGANLALLAFKRLEQLAVDGDSATAVIVGELRGDGEYSVSAAFRREAGVWKLAPVPGLTGCAAFGRISG